MILGLFRRPRSPDAPHPKAWTALHTVYSVCNLHCVCNELLKMKTVKIAFPLHFNEKSPGEIPRKSIRKTSRTNKTLLPNNFFGIFRPDCSLQILAGSCRLLTAFIFNFSSAFPRFHGLFANLQLVSPPLEMLFAFGISFVRLVISQPGIHLKTHSELLENLY